MATSMVMLGLGETSYDSAQPTDGCCTCGHCHRRAHRGRCGALPCFKITVGKVCERRLIASGQARVCVVGQETRGTVVVDERVVGEPLDCAALGARVTEGVPHRQQVRMILVQLVFEPAERAVANSSKSSQLTSSIVSASRSHVVVDHGRLRRERSRQRVRRLKPPGGSALLFADCLGSAGDF